MGSGAGAGDVPAVLGDLRLHQHDIQHGDHLGTSEKRRSEWLACKLYAKVPVKSIRKIEKFQTFPDLRAAPGKTLPFSGSVPAEKAVGMGKGTKFFSERLTNAGMCEKIRPLFQR